MTNRVGAPSLTKKPPEPEFRGDLVDLHLGVEPRGFEPLTDSTSALDGNDTREAPRLGPQPAEAGSFVVGSSVGRLESCQWGGSSGIFPSCLRIKCS